MEVAPPGLRMGAYPVGLHHLFGTLEPRSLCTLSRCQLGHDNLPRTRPSGKVGGDLPLGIATPHETDVLSRANIL